MKKKMIRMSWCIENYMQLISKYVHILLMIRITMLVNTASAEKSFLKLKVNKNYLRTSLDQEGLSDFAIILIKNETCVKSLDYGDLINGNIFGSKS